jgi:hypothetical protein
MSKIRGPEASYSRPIRLFASAGALLLAGSADKGSVVRDVVPLSDCEWSQDHPDRPKQLHGVLNVIVIVDGTCDPDPEAPVGIYPQPNQTEAPSVAAAQNGEVLRAWCVELDGQFISDVRGEEYGSAEWHGVTTTSGIAGFIPKVWDRYAVVPGLEPCGKDEPPFANSI